MLETKISSYPPKEQRFSSTAGLPPGTLVHVGKASDSDVRISVITYTKDSSEHHILKDVSEIKKHLKTSRNTWINIDGLHDVELIRKLGKDFGIHTLVLEDVLNTRQRPKVESFEDYIFVSLKMLGISEDRQHIKNEQISLVLGKNWVISFQEREGDLFDTIRTRIADPKGMIRKNEADFLLYRLLDTVVDNYFFVAEFFGESLELLEDDVMDDPDTENLQQIQRIKKLLVQFRRSVYPIREVVAFLDKDSHPLIKSTTKRYLRDLYEHIIQVNESIELQRDLIAGITDLHSSGVSNKMNQVMKLLTVISTIFIPLTFIAGIYGMNFEVMPELKWSFGYAYAWGLMLLIFIGMLFYFKSKKWL